ncbi:unnamed protein product [Paramecium pentaurelia]|uniref:Uncharacterized protein n=1 Tax=Paramecium pentaurelia TaxID=43138 RepID=A0A8S1YAV6_9CILI|nr:unnamed protein product [Paramecium pentaurelia]
MSNADIQHNETHTQRRPTTASLQHSVQNSHPISPLKYDYLVTQHTQNSISPMRQSNQKNRFVQPFSSLAIISKQQIDNDYKKLSLQSPAQVFVNCLPPKAPELYRSTNSPNRIGQYNSKTQVSERGMDDKLSEFSLQLVNNQQTVEDRLKMQDANLLQFKQIKFNKHRNSEQDFKTQQNRLSVRDENIQQSITYSQHTTKHGYGNSDLQTKYDKLKEEYDLQHKFLQEKEKSYNDIQLKYQQLQRLQQQYQSNNSESDQNTIKQLREKLLLNEEKLQEYSVVQFQIQSLKQQKAEVEMKLNRVLTENSQLKNELTQLQQSLSNCKTQVTQVKELELLVEVCQNDQDGFIKSLESKDAEIQYLKNRLQTSQEQLLKFKSDNLKLFNELQNVQSEIKNMQSSILQSQEVMKTNQQLTLDIENLELSKNVLQEQQDNILDQYKRLSSINETLKQQYQSSQQEINQLRTIFENEKQNYEQQIQDQKYMIEQQDNDLQNAKIENEQNTQKISELTQYYQAQFAELQQSLDNWFRQQIEIELKKVVDPITDERDYYQEKFKEAMQKCESLEDQNQDIIAEYESLTSKHLELKMLFDQIKTISSTQLKN